MGYSGRYHATSLIAVFLALAIGILIGATLGGDVVDATKADLERSLTGNLEEARERVDRLSGELRRSEELAERVYPVLVRDQLRDTRIGLVALGELPGDLTRAVEEALEPTGGRLVVVGVVREPFDLRALAEELQRTRLADLARDPERQRAFAVGVGRQLVLGGPLLETVRSELLLRASGSFGDLDGVVVVREQPPRMSQAQRAVAEEIESGLIEGIATTPAVAVGVEDTEAERSSIPFFQSNDLPNVDHVDTVAGQLATVFALLGTEGSFGVKGTADRLLPDLLMPPR